MDDVLQYKPVIYGYKGISVIGYELTYDKTFAYKFTDEL